MTQTVLFQCCIIVIHSMIQSRLRALCWTLSAVTVNCVAVEKWTLNFRETWHPQSCKIKQKYYCLGWPSCNKPQWPAVLHFPNWNEDINLWIFPHSPKATLLPCTYKSECVHAYTFAHALTHSLLHRAIKYSTLARVCVCARLSNRLPLLQAGFCSGGSVRMCAWLSPLSSTASQEEISRIAANKCPAYSQTGLDMVI